MNRRRELRQQLQRRREVVSRHVDDVGYNGSPSMGRPSEGLLTSNISVLEVPDAPRKIIHGGVTGRTRVVVKDGFCAVFPGFISNR